MYRKIEKMAMRPIINKFCKPLGLIIAISTLSSNNLLSQVTIHVLGIAQDAGRPQAGCKKICCVNDMGELRPPRPLLVDWLAGAPRTPPGKARGHWISA